MKHSPNDNDDADWLELMRGQAAPDARSTTRAEAAWFRAALLAYRQPVPPGAIPDPELRGDVLIRQARLQGVLSSAKNPNSQNEYTPASVDMGDSKPRSQRPSPLRGWARQLLNAHRERWPKLLVAMPVVALVLATSIVLVMQSELPTEEALRGAPVQQVVSDRPAATQQTLLRTFTSAGLEANAFTRLGRPSVELMLPTELTEVQRQALAQWGLRRPDSTVLVIEVVTH